MGLVLDSSVIVSAERQTLPVSALLEGLRERHGASPIILSAISVVELEHGIYRARSTQQKERRRIYLDEVFSTIPAAPFTDEIARLVARIDAESRQAGKAIPFADLLIGGTALHLGYSLATGNRRHFAMIPNLDVLPV
ncbi:MAG: PIN domain-containing protein [Acidobacteria bacterium]|nr:PIN domain-containing protein [Acidobacteriota bacterium]